MSSTSRSVSPSASAARPRSGRVRPWLALRALASQIRDSENTEAGARFVYALQGKTTERLFQRFRTDPGRRVRSPGAWLRAAGNARLPAFAFRDPSSLCAAGSGGRRTHRQRQASRTRGELASGPGLGGPPRAAPGRGPREARARAAAYLHALFPRGASAAAGGPEPGCLTAVTVGHPAFEMNPLSTSGIPALREFAAASGGWLYPCPTFFTPAVSASRPPGVRSSESSGSSGLRTPRAPRLSTWT